jgi:hypothetical protein
MGSVPTDSTTLGAVAFVFGYAEAAFRELIKRATDALILPGGKAAQTHRPTSANPTSTTPKHRDEG